MATGGRGEGRRSMTMRFDVHDEVVRAHARLAGRVFETPLLPSPWLSRATGAEVRLKLENLQHTGSFKVRGATNALLCLSAGARARGVVAASSGNHGLGLAFAARAVGCAVTVFVPATTPAPKRAAIEALGAEVQVFGDDCLATEVHARAFAARAGRQYVSPYNDAHVVAGQGTVAVELLRQWPEVEVVYVAIGGGGLLSGMAGHARGEGFRTEWVACSPAASPAMQECVRQGRIVAVPCGETWSDSTAGGVESGAITFALCRELVDRWLEVDEAAIERTLRACLAEQHLLVEGAAAVAMACCRADPLLRGRRACVVVCGGNLPFELLQRLCAPA
jgi:threonine dehydratase